MAETYHILSLHGAVKRREQSGSVFELHVPCFEIRAGEVAGVVGDSGCGKSTLLDILALVMQPSSVDNFVFKASSSQKVDIRFLWESREENSLAALRREHMGYILQTGGLLSFLNVRANAALPAQINGTADYAQRIDILSRRLGIEQCLNRYPDSLSIGQRQRVAIMRALAHVPSIILADEPTAAVDKARAKLIMKDLRNLAIENNTAVIVVTHDMDMVAAVDALYSFTLEQVTSREIRSYCRRQS